MKQSAIEQARMALGIRSQGQTSLSAKDFDRLRKYVDVHYGSKIDVLLHNSHPFLEGAAGFAPMRRLVFRGSARSYAAIGQGFTPIVDARFPVPCIIRDNWAERRVTTHMQTKSVLAWSKSFYVALEYAVGQIKGHMGNVTPGYLHFCFAETGIDVVQAVRAWEEDASNGFQGAIDPGRQHEIITPTVPRERILATWELMSVQDPENQRFLLQSKTEHAGNFAAVKPLYDLISRSVNVGATFDYVELGNTIDRQILS